MARPQIDAVALVQELRDAKTIDEKRSVTKTLKDISRRLVDGEKLIAAGSVPVIVNLFVQCSDDKVRRNSAYFIGFLVISDYRETIAATNPSILEALVDFVPYVDEDGQHPAVFALTLMTSYDTPTAQQLRDVPGVCDTLREAKESGDDTLIDDLLDRLLPLSTSGKRIKPARAYIENGASANRRSRAG